MADNEKETIENDVMKKDEDACEAPGKSGIRKGIILIPLCLAALVMICIVLFFLLRPGKEGGEESTELGYDANAVVVTDEDELQKLVDEMQNKDGQISLEYKNVASSADGSNFSCYIANSAKNKYDMYIGIYTDADFEDELYLSQLMRPGTGIKEFACKKELAPGSYEVILVFTLVKDDHKTIQSQTPVTYTLNVVEPNE